MQAKFYKTTVLSEITNNDWEGEIKGQGDKVYIRSIPTITVRSYVKGQNLTNEVPMSTPLELNIDKGQYFSVVLDDVDAVQADVKLMDMFTNDATEQMKITIDTDVLNGVKASAAAANKGATAGAHLYQHQSGRNRCYPRHQQDQRVGLDSGHGPSVGRARTFLRLVVGW